MEFTNKKGICESIIKNKQNLERYIIFQTEFLYFTAIVIQEGSLEEEVGHPWVTTAPVTHWQCVLINTLESPGLLSLCQATKGFNL